jgi:hypothetical protein
MEDVSFEETLSIRGQKNHSYFTLQKAFSCRHPTRKWWQLTTNNKKII